jgi:ribonuclease T2
VRTAIARRAIFVVSLLAWVSAAAGAQKPAEPGHFDYYLLNLSWSPDFCAHLASSPQCAAHPGFVLHGLWPQNRDGSWPANCVTQEPGPSQPSAWLDITPDLSLISHEWTKHGSCTTLNGDTYFTLARQAYHSVAIPPSFVGMDRETTMAPEEIVSQFVRANSSLSAEDLNVVCDNDHLTAVEVCLGKDLQPASCSALHACQAKSVTITPQTSPRQ